MMDKTCYNAYIWKKWENRLDCLPFLSGYVILVPMNDTAMEQQSESDFTRARSHALVNEIQHFLTPEETNLLSFYEVKRILKPGNEVYLGMRVVPLTQIVGSEGRYSDFDNHFFPKNLHLKKRWQSIDQANLQDVILPPIKLYELGGLYFVRDGNHRVSVAKSRGIEFIDAEVTALNSEIKLDAGVANNHRSLLREVIDYEKRSFYGETAFGDITDCWDLDFSTPGQYDVINSHIHTHLYYRDQQQRLSGLPQLTVVEGVRAWFVDVYSPVIKVIQEKKLLASFKGRTAGDLYVWLIRYWDDLKHKFGNDYSLEVAAQEFRAEFKESFFTKISKFFKKFPGKTTTE